MPRHLFTSSRYRAADTRTARFPWRAAYHPLDRGVVLQRRSRIPSMRGRPAGGVGGFVRNGRGENRRSLLKFSLQCDARPNAGRIDAALAPV